MTVCRITDTNSWNDLVWLQELEKGNATVRDKIEWKQRHAADMITAVKKRSEPFITNYSCILSGSSKDK